ncbi:MAG: DNA repair protein RadC [Mariprofundaceae bacterium]
MQDDSVKGHRERLKLRFFKSSLDDFHDYEVLEMLLLYAIPRVDVKPLAKRLLKQFGSLSGVFDASYIELQQVYGVGDKAALFIKFIRQVGTRYLASELPLKCVFDQPEKVRNHLRLLLQGRGTECFGAIFTDQANRHLLTQILFEGTVDRTVVYPRNLIKRALELNAKGMILFHNHPGGTLQASAEDIALTKQMQDICQPLSLKVLDHFLVADHKVLSFLEHTWM